MASMGIVFKGAQAEWIYSLENGEGSAFEKETIYREGLAQKYDTAFKQIWTFGTFMFFSTFLLLMALDRKEYIDKSNN